MSRIYEALRQRERENRSKGLDSPEPVISAVLPNHGIPEPAEPIGIRPAVVEARATSRLVALTEPRSLGAEKFRSLATRLENLRRERALKSVQITSSVVGEGKTLVSANLAITLAAECAAKVLLIEGDLRRPALASRLGLTDLTGLHQWWDTRDQGLTQFLYRLNQWPLFFLAAGGVWDQPSHLLQSRRFADAFLSMTGAFDWIVVDSTPMTPAVDASLWSRLVDGTLLVVREGVAPVNAVKKGLEALDNPKLLGVVLNEASEFDRTYYQDQYYTSQEKELYES
ncbi:MAG TPA: CpsD/CapB family tyrosine-protein kinase [Candidatus Acidoferrum sp.]|jgi:receptor protein-tyrosine kinase